MDQKSSGPAKQARTTQLADIVHKTTWLLRLLQLVKELGPPEAFVAAGAIRDTVWDVLTGRASTGPHADVDVVYWAAAEIEGGSHTHEMRLRAADPSINWEVTNQATVHLWHWRTRGLLVAPLQSVADGLSSWPETATAVGIRLTKEGAVDILAPLGLVDLFALRLRHNPAQEGTDIFWQRVESKRWMQRWPELELVSPRER
ncbi:MAG: nucleotidyltransferase family protein [Deltaproteobacteria bacterium]